MDTTAEPLTEIEVSTYTVQGSGAIVCSAMVYGYRKQTAYFLVDKETAIADFKQTLREIVKMKEEA